MGMAVLYKNKDKVKITEDKFNNVIVLKTEKGKLIYYFLAAWEQESEGIKTQEEFIKYIEEIIQKLNLPLSIEIM